MAWFAVIDNLSGQLLSLTTIVADPLPAGLVALNLADQPDLATQMWDEATRSFVARPAKVLRDIVDLILADSDLPALTVANKLKVRTVLERWIPLDARKIL